VIVSAKERLSSNRTLELALFADSPLVKDYFELQQRLQIRKPPLDLRISNGSFTVTNYYDADDDASEHCNAPTKATQQTTRTRLPPCSILRRCTPSCRK
jgi:hypothetical protein